MPRPSPFHPRTSRLCTSWAWKEWAGFLAVRHYGACPEPEYQAFRHAAGVLDVSPLYKYRVTGKDAGDFLSFLFTRDLSRLQIGRVTYACFTDAQGHVIDDGTVARLDDGAFRVTTASPSLSWFLGHARGFDVTLEDVSESTAALAVQGPTSGKVLSAVTDGKTDDLRFFRTTAARIDGRDVEVSRTGYTGDLGYEIWMDADDALPVWDALGDAGRGHALLPCGLDALDITRIEAGFILQDVDYYSSIRAQVDRQRSTPYEIGLGWTVQLDRDPFIGQAALRAAAASPGWSFVGLEIDWDELAAFYEALRLPPHLPTEAWRTPLPLYAGHRQVGQATSGAWSPLLKRNLALASVQPQFAQPGTRIRIEQTVEYRRHQVTATVMERPFFDPERKRA